MSSLYAIQHSFRKSSSVTKQTLYFTLVRSLIEYACIVWDPVQNWFICLIRYNVELLVLFSRGMTSLTALLT